MVPVPSRFVDPKPPLEPVRLGAGADAGDLDRWVSTGRVEEAAAERSRRRWLERQAREDSRLVGMLLDLAERAASVTVRTIGGRTVSGPVAGVGADYVTVDEQHRGRVVVPLHAVATVRSPADAGLDDRALTGVVDLAAMLTELAADRPGVVVRAGGDDTGGDLVAGGRDVITVRTSGADGSTVHIALAAIDHLVVLDG